MAFIKKRPRAGGMSYVVVYKIDGHQGGLTFWDERKAEAFKATVEAHGARRALEMHDIDPEPRHRSRPGGMTLPEWIRRHIDDRTGLEHYSIDKYNEYLENDIRPFFGDIPLAGLGAEGIG